MSSTDKAAINQIFNKNGTNSTDGTTYKLTAADDWNTVIGNINTADTTGNPITVSNVPIPTIASATYDVSTGALVVTGSGFLKSNGFSNDIVASKFTFTGEGGGTYTLTDSANVEITSTTAFTIALSVTDKNAVNQIVNKNGTSSTGGTTYNLAAAEDWAAGADSAVVVADTTGNGITVSNVAVPAITSATYNASTGALVVTGSDFLKLSGATNDIVASKFTFIGEGGSTYTLTDSANVEITSTTAFTIALSVTDKNAVNQIVNKNGTSSTDGTTYNLAAAEDWAAGANAAVVVADTTGNGITVTLSPSSSGGGGGSCISTITDGATVTTTRQPDGTTIIVVSIIQSSRQDDPNSLFRDYADITIAKDTADNPLLIVSLPTGAGLTTADRAQTLDLARAEADVIVALTQINGLNSNAVDSLAAKAREFLAQLQDANPMSIHTVTPRFVGNQPPTLPLIISSPAADKPSNMLVIDARELPSGTVIQLDNVPFASIIGTARVTSGSGENFAVGDDQNQFIVLGADDDILFGGGGDDTVGSLGGNDQTSGDAGNNTVYGGTGNDILSGGTGNDRINGGIGFDSAIQAGQLSDYRIAAHGNAVTLTQASGETDTLTDVESVRFASGLSLAIAYSDIEAVSHHLAKNWLGRDLTVTEGSAVQNWVGATSENILTAFRGLPETIELGLQNKTDDELLVGWNTDPTIIRINAVRDFTGGDENNQGYLPSGLAMNADGGEGYDVLRILGGRNDVHLEFFDNCLELTQLSDGAMFSLKNTEMIAFDNHQTVIIAHDQVEATLARLAHSFFNRDVSIAEWQLGLETLQQPYDANSVLNWFHQQADQKDLSDNDYVQMIYDHTLGRSATNDELSLQLARLDNHTIDRNWLTVEIAQSDEAAAYLIGSVMLQEAWIINAPGNTLSTSQCRT